MRKSGISLMALVATVVIISILISTITISGIATVNNANKLTFASEISFIQESVNSYISRNTDSLPISDSVQLDVSGVTAASRSQFDGEEILNDKIVLNAIDYKLLGITSLKYGLKENGVEDIYVLSTTTKKVYYAKGLTVGSKTYYTLTEDLSLAIKYKTPGNNVSAQNGIVFLPSEIEWTKQNVTVQVKVPKEYTSKIVKANNVVVPLKLTDNEYDIYEVNNISGNYQIVVDYALNVGSPVISSKYDVNNVDNIPPVLSLDKDNQKFLKSDNPSETYAYFEILQKSDSLSGVKYVKYENERILNSELETYFKTNGKVVNKDIIKIGSGVREITVYIEDNTGNWTVDFVTVSDEIYTGLLNE